LRLTVQICNDVSVANHLCESRSPLGRGAGRDFMEPVALDTVTGQLPDRLRLTKMIEAH